jgi:hypothetical protein
LAKATATIARHCPRGTSVAGNRSQDSTDRENLEVAIKKELGYEVKYSEERLKAPEVFPPENKLKPNR